MTEILDLIKSKKYEVIGLRFFDHYNDAKKESVYIGKKCRKSRYWIPGEQTRTTKFLPGTSAVRLYEFGEESNLSETDLVNVIDYVKNNYALGNSKFKLAFIAGNDAGNGQDNNEVIVSNAKIIYVL